MRADPDRPRTPPRRKRAALLALGLATLLLARAAAGQSDIPWPEHPRPDFERPAWLNLNGKWQFRFDAADEGLTQAWEKGEKTFPLAITVQICQEVLAEQDCVLIVTDHTRYDYDFIAENCRLLVDTRNATAGCPAPRCRIVKA